MAQVIVVLALLGGAILGTVGYRRVARSESNIAAATAESTLGGRSTRVQYDVELNPAAVAACKGGHVGSTNGMAEADAAGRGSEVGAPVGDASGDGDAPPSQVSVSLS